MSDSFSRSASSPLSAEDRYFLSWNFFSKSATCCIMGRVYNALGKGRRSKCSKSPHINTKYWKRLKEAGKMDQVYNAATPAQVGTSSIAM